MSTPNRSAFETENRHTRRLVSAPPRLRVEMEDGHRAFRVPKAEVNVQEIEYRYSVETDFKMRKEPRRLVHVCILVDARRNDFLWRDMLGPLSFLYNQSNMHSQAPFQTNNSLGIPAPHLRIIAQKSRETNHRRRQGKELRITNQQVQQKHDQFLTKDTDIMHQRWK